MFLQQRCFWKLNMDDSLHIDSIFNSTFSIYQNYNTFYSCGFVFFMNLSLSDVSCAKYNSVHLATSMIEIDRVRTSPNFDASVSFLTPLWLDLLGWKTRAFSIHDSYIENASYSIFVLEMHVIFEKVLKDLVVFEKESSVNLSALLPFSTCVQRIIFLKKLLP